MTTSIDYSKALIFRWPEGFLSCGDTYESITMREGFVKPTEEEVQVAWEGYLVQRSIDLKNSKLAEVDKEKEQRSFSEYSHAFQHGIFTQVINIINKDLIGLKKDEMYTLTAEEKEIMRNLSQIEQKVNSVVKKAEKIKTAVTNLTTDKQIQSFNVKDENLWADE